MKRKAHWAKRALVANANSGPSPYAAVVVPNRFPPSPVATGWWNDIERCRGVIYRGCATAAPSRVPAANPPIMPAATCPFSAPDGHGQAINAVALIANKSADEALLMNSPYREAVKSRLKAGSKFFIKSN